LRQKPLLNFIVDFFCYELRLIIEVGGFSHYNQEAYEKDQVRQRKLEDLGLTVLRLDDDEIINDIENALRSIIGYIEKFEERTSLD